MSFKSSFAHGTSVWVCILVCGCSCVWSDLSLHFMSCSQLSACLSDRPLHHVLHWQPAHCQTGLCVLFPLSAPSVLSFTFLPATLAKLMPKVLIEWDNTRSQSAIFHFHTWPSLISLCCFFFTKASWFKYISLTSFHLWLLYLLRSLQITHWTAEEMLRFTKEKNPLRWLLFFATNSISKV